MLQYVTGRTLQLVVPCKLANAKVGARYWTLVVLNRFFYQAAVCPPSLCWPVAPALTPPPLCSRTLPRGPCPWKPWKQPYRSNILVLLSFYLYIYFFFRSSHFIQKPDITFYILWRKIWMLLLHRQALSKALGLRGLGDKVVADLAASWSPQQLLLITWLPPKQVVPPMWPPALPPRGPWMDVTHEVTPHLLIPTLHSCYFCTCTLWLV